MNLYEITTGIEEIEEHMDKWAAENEGDISAFPLNNQLDNLTEAKNEKILSIGVWHKNLLAKEKMIAEEIKSLNARRAALKTKAENIKKYMSSNIKPGERLESAKCAISWRRSEQVTIGCEMSQLPEYFQKVEIKADKVGLKKAIKEGQKIDNVELITNHSIQVK